MELRDALAEQLAEQGKTDWARQEFDAVLARRARPAAAPDPWRRTSGIHRVRNRRGLAVVRELWQERDKIARQRDLSPTRVLPDAAIVEAARSLPTGRGQPGRASPASPAAAPGGTPSEWLRRSGRARAQPDRALPTSSAPPGDGPPPAHRWADRDPDAATRLTAVRAVVAALADEHHLPAENLLPPDAVRRLAWQPPEPVSERRSAAAWPATAPAPGRSSLTARRRSPGRCCGVTERAES